MMMKTKLLGEFELLRQKVPRAGAPGGLSVLAATRCLTRSTDSSACGRSSFSPLHKGKVRFLINTLPMSERPSSPRFFFLLRNKSDFQGVWGGKFPCCVCKSGAAFAQPFVFLGEATGSVNCCSAATRPACCRGNIQTPFC